MAAIVSRLQQVNTSRPRQNGCHFADGIFKCIFLNEDVTCKFRLKFHCTEVCSQGFIWQYASIGSDNGLPPGRRQAIIWTNDGLVYLCIYASLGLNESTHLHLVPHISVSVSVSIGSDNGLLPIQHQAIIWTSGRLLSIGPWRTNFSQI